MGQLEWKIFGKQKTFELIIVDICISMLDVWPI